MALLDLGHRRDPPRDFETLEEPGITTYRDQPGRPPADMLIGAMVLERLDLYADCPGEQRVSGKPGEIPFRT